ncbi:MAG: phosphatidylglycerophosphatase A [Candidatus Omnitrophica bacterium]|nr:phosphatidylglycerophosphatase A [Candidatus Omnitrophota bacterium]
MKNLKSSVSIWAVSCAGLGRIPFAPGTFGAAAGAGVAWLLNSSAAWQWAVTAGAFAAGLIFIPKAQEELGQQDPPVIVIDEFCGALIAFAGFPCLTWLQWTIGFIVFRLLDIVKPPPIRRLEKLPGAWGVLLDDLAAGGVARGIVYWAVLKNLH